MRAIESVVKQFLNTNASRPKAVVNLGCGYDSLPFSILSQCEIDERVKFVDVDYPQLMKRKVNTIRETPQTMQVLQDVQPAPDSADPVLLSSKHYLAVACDLEDFQTLDKLLRSFDEENCDYLFVAEVSLTYMDQIAAEKVIRGASQFKNSHFCLLEQFLPDGAGHPFAVTMLNHFEKLNSYLRSVTRFPSLKEQKQRFSRQGWPEVQANSLWTLWSDHGFVSNEERSKLDALEPFDEWEEFALFASHYFVLTASTTGQENILDQIRDEAEESVIRAVHHDEQKFEAQAIVDSSRRRSGASAKISDGQVILHGGQGSQGRVNSTNSFIKPGYKSFSVNMPELAVETHTVTNLSDGILLIGGRASPNAASDKVFFARNDGTVSSSTLARPLYRHCVVQIGQDSALIFGGKHNATDVSDEWLIWTSGTGCIKLTAVQGDVPPALFGACMVVTKHNAKNGDPVEGILLGGMDTHGIISRKAWTWTLWHDTHTVSCKGVMNHNFPVFDMFRFGATLTALADSYVLCGGVGSSGTVAAQNEIVVMDKSFSPRRIDVDWQNNRPMLVGCGVQAVESGHLLVMGGGATCFSFGTHWNTSGYMVSLNQQEVSVWKMSNLETSARKNFDNEMSEDKQKILQKRKSHKQDRNRNEARGGKTIDRVQLSSAAAFDEIMQCSRPVVMENLNIGACTSLWTVEYMKRKSPPDLSVTVHDAGSPHMSFLDKNFAYKSMPFVDFLDAITSADVPAAMYLRAISSSLPSSTPTLLGDDFPFLASDVSLPPELDRVTQNVHSSPLRIAGHVSMWLHYDVMANVYCQVRGQRRFLLYPPAAAATHLDFPPGQSSARKNPFATRAADRPPPHLERFEALLSPGDVLYIPPFWAHAAAPPEQGHISSSDDQRNGSQDQDSGVSVAVNVFFRSLAGEHVYAAGRDTYANRDLAAYEHGRKAVQRVLGQFGGLPQDARQFYLERLARELRDGARKGAESDHST